MIIVKEAVVENYLKAILYNNGIIEIIWDTSIIEIEVIHLRKMQQTVYELGGGKKMPLYFAVEEFLGINREAMQFATSKEGVKYTLAVAVLVDNIAKNILLNFFMNINKPIVPTKGFTNRADCFLWLTKKSIL